MVNNLSINRVVRKTHRPYSYVESSLKARVIAMLLMLFLQLVLLAIDKSFMALIIVLVATVSSVLSNFIANSVDAVLYKDDVKKSAILTQYLTSVAQGVIIGLLTPVTVNVFSVFIATLFVMLIAKWLFGGFAQSPSNVCALSIVIMYLISGASFSQGALTGVYNLKTLIESGSFTFLKNDESITNALNTLLFNRFGASLPAGYVSLLWDNHCAIAAFRYNLITLVSLAVLCISDGGKVAAVHFFLIIYAALSFIFGDFINSGKLFSGDVLFALNMNGVLFCATFVLCWYGALPLKKKSRFIVGILYAAIAFFITGCQFSAVGLPLAVVVVNFICMFLQYVENKTDFLYTKHLLDQVG